MGEDTRSELWKDEFKRTVNDLYFYNSRLEYIIANDRGDDKEALMALYNKLSRRDILWSNMNFRINNLWSRRERTKIRRARYSDSDFDEIERLLTEAEDKEWRVVYAIIGFVVLTFFLIFYRLTEKQCPDCLPLECKLGD